MNIPFSIPQSMNMKKILIIDDFKFDRIEPADLGEENKGNYQITSLRTWAAVFEAIVKGKETYDCIVVDLGLTRHLGEFPELDNEYDCPYEGIKFIRWLRRSDTSTPIIVYSRSQTNHFRNELLYKLNCKAVINTSAFNHLELLIEQVKNL